MVKRGLLIVVALALASSVNATQEKKYYEYSNALTIPDNARFLMYDPAIGSLNITGALLKSILGYTHPASHAATMITGLATVATSGSYADLDNKPTIPAAATEITYSNPTYTTVAAALDQLLYVPISITAYTLSGYASNVTQEIGSSYSISGGGLAWTTNKTATSQTINGTPQTSPYMPNSPVSSNQSWTLQVGDGTTTASSTRTVTFTHKRYWGASASSAIDDAGIIALASEFSTSRSQSRTITASGQYLYIAYLATAGSATFTVNGFLDTSWVLVQRDFINASEHPAEFRIYRSANPLTGTYQVVVS